MNREPTLEETMKLAYYLHESQVDRAGFPYWTHPLRVMYRLPADASDAERKMALLHDSFEDTGISEKFLEIRGFGPEVVKGVDLLTHYPKQTTRAYHDRLLQSGNVKAIRVKCSDVFDNCSPGRINQLTEDLATTFRQRYEELGRKIVSVLLKLDSLILLPTAGDPKPDSPVAQYWHPYLAQQYGIPAFAALTRMERACQYGLIAA